MGNLLKLHRDGASSLQFWNLNEEFLVRASHQLALITSLPFVHTARRYYRLNGLVRIQENEKKTLRKEKNLKTTFNGGSLGSRIDEERSELRYVV